MGIRLVVQGDDFGMCHAVNEGIVAGFLDGIVTQSSAMVPCPWFDEAAALARRHQLPTGMHCTLTCEWDYLRWRPLTAGRTLVGEDGTFRRTVLDAREHVDPEEAAAELVAQAERFLATVGSVPIDFDPHMGLIRRGAYAEVCRRHERGFIYPLGEGEHASVSLPWASINALSERGDTATKTAWLVEYVERLGEGDHFLCTHPAQASPEMRSITSPDNPNYVWSEPYRETDLAALCAPEVRAAVERRGIQLVSVADLT